MNDNERLRTAEKLLDLIFEYITIKPYDDYTRFEMYYKDWPTSRAFITTLYVTDKDTYEEIKQLLNKWRTYEKK